MSAATTRRLFNADDIAAAGATAVAGWRLSDLQCDKLAALIAPSAQQIQRLTSDRGVSGRAA